MKQLPVTICIACLIVATLFSAVSCRPKDTPAEAADKDTIHTLMRPQVDNTARPLDTVQVEEPKKDSLPARGK